MMAPISMEQIIGTHSINIPIELDKTIGNLLQILTLIPAWITNCIHIFTWDVITMN